MRVWVAGLLLLSVCLAQRPSRTFLLTNTKSGQDVADLVRVVQQVLDFRDLSPDPQRSGVMARGTDEQLVAAEWLIRQLDQPAGGVAVSPDYVSGTGEELRVFRLKPPASQYTLSSLVTAIRTASDLPLITPLLSAGALVVRGPLEKVNAAEWVFQQLTLTGATGDSPTYPMPSGRPDRPDEILRVLRMNPECMLQTLLSTASALRVIADIQRLMPVESQRPLIVRATPNRVAAAAWLVYQLSQQTHSISMSETKYSNVLADSRREDDVIRMYYFRGTEAAFKDLVQRLQQEFQRTFRFDSPTAVVVRAPADQIAAAQWLVDWFDDSAKFAAR